MIFALLLLAFLACFALGYWTGRQVALAWALEVFNDACDEIREALARGEE